jgi:pimeloyl-ACP methyl ester carboxylesterase
MKGRLVALFITVAGLYGVPVYAELMLLVHGYLSGAQSWDSSGIVPTLERQGWRRAGVFVAGPGASRLIPVTGANTGKKIYSIDLPSEAPVTLQAVQLREAMDYIGRAHKDEAVYLVGHSAGGVVARAALVQGDSRNIKALITVASPHLGTSRAEQVLDVTEIPFPLSLLAGFFGGEVYDTARRSRSLYVDLVRPRPGTLLFWLNQVQHPDIHYLSIIHTRDASGSGDYVVPAYSQDMNNIPVLSGKSTRVILDAPHGLSALDGVAIINLLARLGD